MFDLCILRLFEKQKLMWSFIYASGRNNLLFVTQLILIYRKCHSVSSRHLNFLHSITNYDSQAIYKLLKTIRINRYEKSTVVPIYTFWDSIMKDYIDLWFMISCICNESLPMLIIYPPLSLSDIYCKTNKMIYSCRNNQSI